MKRYEEIGYPNTAKKLRKRWENGQKNDFIVRIADSVVDPTRMAGVNEGYAFIVTIGETLPMGNASDGLVKIENRSETETISRNKDGEVRFPEYSLIGTFDTIAAISSAQNKLNLLHI